MLRKYQALGHNMYVLNQIHILPKNPNFEFVLPTLTMSSKPRGRQLLDHEAMTCLLVLLFVDEPKLNTIRLHRVLRYLCHHTPTRDWVIKVSDHQYLHRQAEHSTSLFNVSDL